MKRIVIAPDSFKESLSAADVATYIEAGFRSVFPECDYIKAPVADGGEGTVDALVAATAGRTVPVSVTGPLGEPVAARYGISGDGSMAFVEIAAAAGLTLAPSNRRDPLIATTYGVGELILAALQPGVTRLIVGLGGSATNDGGAGMAQAFGARLLDGNGADIPWGGGALDTLAAIDISGLDPRLRDVAIEVACDVDSPLVGPDGASAIFGPQKGATPAMVARLDANLQLFGEMIAKTLNIEVLALPGGGAAGGLGAGLLAFAGARLRPGVAIVTDAMGLDALIADADLVITGEGRIDGQSIRGKTPIGVAAIAMRHGKPVIGMAGSLGTDAQIVHDHGIDATFSVLRRVGTMEDAFADAATNITAAARNIAAAIGIGIAIAKASDEGGSR